MKTTKYVSALIAIFAIAFLSTLESCKKDDSTDSGSSGTAVTKSGLLTTGSWVMTSMEVTFPAPIGAMDMFASMDDCEKDDLVIFNSDKTVTDDEGATKCDSTDPQTSTGGSWNLTSSDTKLAIEEDGESFEFDIVSLTSDALSLTVTQYDSSFQADITIKVAYKH
jgi:hypothetical protein